MQSALLFVCMLLMTLRVTGGPLDDLQANFQTRCDFVEADRAVQMEKLDASYLAALNREIEKAKATGKLDAVIPLIDETQAIKTGKDPLPELPQGSSLELKQMRAKHTETRAKILKSHAESIAALADKMETALKAKEQELTKAGKIDEALAAKGMREALAGDTKISGAQKMLEEKSVSGWQPLQKATMKVLNQSQFSVQWMDVEMASRLPEPVAQTVTPKVRLADSALQMIPKSSAQFSFNKPVTSFKCEVFLGADGDAKVTLRTGEEHIKSVEVEKGRESRVLECQFSPTPELVIEVDDKGVQHGDWIYLINPVFR